MNITSKAGLLSVAIACGGAQTPVTENVHLDKPDAAATAATNAVIEKLGIPHDAPFFVTFDATALARINELRSEIEHTLDLASGTLLDNAASFGFDVKRPVTIAVAPLDDAQTKLITDLRATASDKPTPVSDQAVQRVLAAGSPIVIRFLLPTTDAGKLTRTITTFLHSDHWHHTASGWDQHTKHLEITDDGQNVAVDLTSSRGRGERAASAAMAKAHDAPPNLDGRTVRASWSPAALANLGYLDGLAKTCEAVSGDSIDASQRARIVEQGFWEASRVFALATFDRVDVEGRLDPFELVGRARPGASFAALPADALTQAPGYAMAGSVMFAQASRAFLKGWSFPGGSARSTLEMMRDGGFAAVFVGIPHIIAASAELEPRRAALFDISRFDRVGTAFGPNEVYMSVLPAGTKRAAAECALAPSTPCDAKTRLKLGAIAKVDEVNVKLLELDKRFIVIASRSDSAPLSVQAQPRMLGALHMDVDTSMATNLVAPKTLPPHLNGELTTDNGTIVFRLAP